MAGKGKIENLKHFEKGNKLGKGKPPGYVSLKSLIAKSLSEKPNFKLKDGKKNDKDYARLMIARIFGIILKGEDKVALDAFKHLTETIDGKPAQRIESDSTATVSLKDINFSTLTDGQLNNLIDKLSGGD